MTEEKEPNGIKFVDLGKHRTCLQCHKRYCTCLERQNGTWDNDLTMRYNPPVKLGD